MIYGQPNSRLPAPYELNNLSPGVGQYLAKGGRTSKGHKGMEKVHMNSHELEILDHLQGGAEHGPGGIKVYSHLEELLKNPHIIRQVHHHARHHHAAGGIENLKRMGRFGDNQIAMIGPNTQHLFNYLAGGPTKNPETGHTEYWTIGNALSGLWNTVKGIASPVWDTVKGVAQAAAPALLPMAQGALTTAFGPLGGLAGGMLGQGIQSALGSPSQSSNPYHQALGQSIGQAAQAYGGGASPSQAFGQGLNNFGSQVGGGFGNALASSGQALQQGQGWGSAARMGAQRGFNELGGMQGLKQAAGQLGQGLMQGGFGGARQAAQNQMGQYMQRAMPRPANRSIPYQDHGYGMQTQGNPEYDQYETSAMYG